MSDIDLGPRQPEMVDRVAKAAANAYFGEDCWDALTEEVFDQFVAVARAAIEAMREPTRDMTEAGYEAYRKADQPALSTSYKAMIDAALTASRTATP